MRRKKQSIEIDLKITQMIELVGKDIKTYILKKVVESMGVLRKDM